MKTGIVPSSRVTPRRGLRAASYVAPCARVNAAIDNGYVFILTMLNEISHAQCDGSEM